MKIAFLDFWTGFNSYNNFFIHILKQIKNNVVVVNPQQADIIIYSCFGNTHYRFNDTKKIFYTGENKRPNFNECDYSISFDFDDYGNKNVRIPLWYLYIDWFGVQTYDNPNWLIPVSYLNKNNEFTDTNKTKFCATVFSAYHKIRIDSVSKLNTYKNVDCYGKVFNNLLPDGERYKMDVIKNHKFSMCFENTLYPGYFTEKLLHAKIAGGIPLYFSDKSYVEDFNEKCCLNLINYENLDDFLDEIKKIDNDVNLYNKISKEPLFTNTPNLDKLKHNLFSIL